MTSGVQKISFPSGGFALHKVRMIGSTCTFSAWYDVNGELIDAIAYTYRGEEKEPTETQKQTLANLGLNNGKF